jgi:hypothetical protein
MNDKAVALDLPFFVERSFPMGSRRSGAENGDGQKSQRFSTLRLLGERGSQTALVPKDWLAAPVFKPGLQRKNAPFLVAENTWVMGADNALTDTPSADIDLSHVRIILAILSFWVGGNPVQLSMSELARRCASSRGGRYFRDLRRKMDDLRNYWISIVDKNGGKRSFPLLKSVHVVTKPPRHHPEDDQGKVEIWLDKVELAEPFAELLRDWTQIMHLNLNTLKELTSEIAQAIYLYLPSRAFHHTEASPFEIRLALLLEQLGMPVPSAPSKRKELFTQHKRSVLTQLDGAEILTGKLRVALTPTGDNADYKLLAWVEKGCSLAETEPSEGPLFQAWISSGRSGTDYEKRKNNRQPLTNYEEELLGKAGIELESTRSFFSIARSLLGEPRFHSLISEVKAEALEGRAPNNPTGALICRMIRSIEESTPKKAAS